LQREPRLAAPSDAGQRDESVVAEELSHLGDLPLASDEYGALHRQVVREVFERAQRREAALEPGGRELEDVLGFLEIFEPVGAEIDERNGSSAEISRRLRQQYLAAVSGLGYALGPVDVEADVVARPNECLTGVDAHANAQAHVVGPRIRLDRALRVGGRCDGAPGP